MRQIDITEECLAFIDKQDQRTNKKFFQLLEVISELSIIHTSFIKKLKDTEFYELRIKTGNLYRIIIFAIDHPNLTECKKAICLFGFQKKSTKDYKKAILIARKLLDEYLNEQ